MNSSSEKISVFLHKNYGLVWRVPDAQLLRKTHRIVGTFLGSSKSSSRHNFCEMDSSWLPMSLMSEEVKLLLDKDIIRLFSLSGQMEEPSQSELSAFEAVCNACYTEQNEKHRRAKANSIDENLDLIIAGKRRKLEKLGKSEEINPNELRKELKEGIKDLSRSEVQVPLVICEMDSPFKRIDDSVVRNVPSSDFHFPNSMAQNLRYKTFEDLWSKRFFITDGSKFGSDFLAYPGDPDDYHSQYVVICVPEGLDRISSMSQRELVAKSRLGTTVNKTVLLAFFVDEQQVKFKMIRWPGSRKNV